MFYPYWIAKVDLGLDVYVGPRSERLVVLPPRGPGRYPITCEVTGHERMRAVLEVRST